MFKVNWTGSYPNRCRGVWEMWYNDTKLVVPKELVSEHMSTYGSFHTWNFGTNYEEEWEEYEDGLVFDEWIENNKAWVTKMLSDAGIPTTPEMLEQLYIEIQSKDWRHNSWGGCV